MDMVDFRGVLYKSHLQSYLITLPWPVPDRKIETPRPRFSPYWVLGKAVAGFSYVPRLYFE